MAAMQKGMSNKSVEAKEPSTKKDAPVRIVATGKLTVHKQDDQKE